MSYNLARFPLAVRLSPHRRCINTSKSSSFTCHRAIEMSGFVKCGSVTDGVRIRSALNIPPLLRTRSFSTSYSQGVGGEGSAVKSRKTLPWLALNRAEEGKMSEKVAGNNGGSSWEESTKRLEKGKGDSIWVEPAEKPEKVKIPKTRSASWRQPITRNGTFGYAKNRYSSGGVLKSPKNASDAENKMSFEEEGGAGGEEAEKVDDPRWDEIRNKFQRMKYSKSGSDRPEYRKWNKQEAWGKRTWKEATELTVPKLVGEVVYGVGPVLAALSAGRREFYALYIQEGLVLSGNNKKKKDLKGFEKVLKIAEQVGLSVKEASKHDLNMAADNRPHQGLVLDASPLEMVKIKELDSILSDGEKCSLWLALDEVTDPQNLGAIIRSAYFFGASGVVLCAKNSAPLSGVVSKASAGSLELMELRYCKNMMRFLVSSAENGWRVIGGSVASKAKPLNQISAGAPTVLVLGSEGTGLRPLVERSCTELVRIPGNVPVDVTKVGEPEDDELEVNSGYTGMEFQSFMAVESLNVSVAAGVLLHHLIGNKHNSGTNASEKLNALLK